MSTIYLIRHGKTQANLDHLYCGSTDLPLSEPGRAELKGLHYDISGAAFVTSGMRRTNETLELLFGPVPHAEDPGLREMDFGAFEMKGYEQLKDQADYQAWITGDNEANVTPGGESGSRMCARVLQAFSRWQQENRDLVIVTHGGVIAAIMASLFPEEGKNRYQWQPKPGCGYRLDENSYLPLP